MDRNYYKRKYINRRNFSSEKDIVENNFVNRLINQCLISVLFLMGVLVLRFVMPKSNIAKNLKCQLNRNLPIESVKKFAVQNFYAAKEVLLNAPEDNQKLVDKVQKQKSEKVKKNLSPKSQKPKRKNPNSQSPKI